MKTIATLAFTSEDGIVSYHIFASLNGESFLEVTRAPETKEDWEDVASLFEGKITSDGTKIGLMTIHKRFLQHREARFTEVGDV